MWLWDTQCFLFLHLDKTSKISFANLELASYCTFWGGAFPFAKFAQLYVIALSGWKDKVMFLFTLWSVWETILSVPEFFLPLWSQSIYPFLLSLFLPSFFFFFFSFLAQISLDWMLAQLLSNVSLHTEDWKTPPVAPWALSPCCQDRELQLNHQADRAQNIGRHDWPCNANIAPVLSSTAASSPQLLMRKGKSLLPFGFVLGLKCIFWNLEILLSPCSDTCKGQSFASAL